MAKIIIKWRYIKPGLGTHKEHLVKYIATRDGVEKSDESWKNQPATAAQQKLVKELLLEFPDSVQNFEYQDYCQNKTKRTASEFIDRVIEENIDLIGKKENYVEYIAERPHVEKDGTHGLFSQEEEPINLSEVSRTVGEHQGVVWTTVLSLRREDAARLGYDNAKAWKELLRSQADNLAKAMNIPLTELKWYAAFHNEGHHPHVHLISYSEGKEPYMTKQGLMTMKADFANEIFKQDLYQVYEEQTETRDELKKAGQEKIAETVTKINDNGYENETVELLLKELVEKLKNYSGKKVYGYLPKNLKNIVNGIVDELAKDERIEKLYGLWYKQKEETIGIYRNAMPKRIPLSQNNEFRSIRNAVIEEALHIVSGKQPIEARDIKSLPDQEPSYKEVERNGYGDLKTQWGFYSWAKELLDKDSEGYNPKKAIELLVESAHRGNTIAKYRLGRMFFCGEEVEKDIAYALRWLEEAAEDGNSYAEYLLGKTLLKGEALERDINRANEFLRRAAGKGNHYAAYTLGKALLEGIFLEQDVTEALRFLQAAADKDFLPAQYLFGRLLYRGGVIDRDVEKALEYLQRAAKQNANAAYLAGKIRLTDEDGRDVTKAVRLFETAAKGGNDYAAWKLGSMYLYGKDVPKDDDKATAYLNMAAEQGNEYARQLLRNMENAHDDSIRLGVFRIFQSIGRIISEKLEKGQKGKGLVDRKLRRKIEEKKRAHGLKHG